MCDDDMGSYVPSIPDWFDVRKAAQVAAFFASKQGGRINILKLMKLIYLADRESMAERDHPITGDDLKALRLGPVPSITYDFAKDAARVRTGEWREFIAPRDGHDVPLARPVGAGDLDELSRSDMRILEATWNQFQHVDQWELAEWTHDFCPEWSDPGASSREIPYAEVYGHLGKSDPAALADELRGDRLLAASLRH